MHEWRGLRKILTKRSATLARLFVERQSLLLLSLLGITLLAFSVSTGHFLRVRVFSVIAFQCAEIGLMGLGMGLAMLINGVDLSVNDTANLSALMAGLFISRVLPQGLSPTLMGLFIIGAIIIALIIGVICGGLNGFLIGYLHIPPILATLATLTLYRGISVMITGGKTLTGFPEQLSVIGRSTIFGIPIPFFIFLVIAITIYIVLNYTVAGFKMRMVGTNTNTARYSGINDKFITMRVYMLSGILSSLAGIIIMSRTGSVAYEYGTQTYILLALLIGSLAGISPGFASIAALVLATFILQVLSTGFYTLLMTSSRGGFFKNLFWGAFLIVVLAVGQIMRRKRGIR